MVKWQELEDRHQFIPEGPDSVLVTISRTSTRRESCFDDVPVSVKRRKGEPNHPRHVKAVMSGRRETQSQTNLRR